MFGALVCLVLSVALALTTIVVFPHVLSSQLPHSTIALEGGKELVWIVDS